MLLSTALSPEIKIHNVDLLLNLKGWHVTYLYDKIILDLTLWFFSQNYKSPWLLLNKIYKNIKKGIKKGW